MPLKKVKKNPTKHLREYENSHTRQEQRSNTYPVSEHVVSMTWNIVLGYPNPHYTSSFVS